MKELFQQFYNGLFRFAPLKKQINLNDLATGVFPSVGFLNNDKKEELEAILGITIHKIEYFEQALIHRSYLQVLADHKYFSNERLEFLGDAVLGLVAGEYLFSLHSTVLEGELTKMRSWLVNYKSLTICARKLMLDKYLMLSYSASKSLESGCDSMLADALEAIIGAIYLDSGLVVVKNFIINSLVPIMMNKSIMVDNNFKSILLEDVQAKGKTAPKYLVIEENGPDHNKEFTVGVYVDDLLLATGIGKSKKEAEQDAAHNAINNSIE